VNQPPHDLREHLNASGADVCGRIENNRFEKYRAGMEIRHHFDEEHVAFIARPLLANAAGLQPFTERLRAVHWPASFNVIGVNTYDGMANPTQWLTRYEIAVLATRGDEDIMANYLPILLDQSANNWPLNLQKNTIHSWDDLKQAFTTNYLATCEQLVTKYDLEKIQQSFKDSL
jgi:hypothetical protein